MTAYMKKMHEKTDKLDKMNEHKGQGMMKRDQQ